MENHERGQRSARRIFSPNLWPFVRRVQHSMAINDPFMVYIYKKFSKPPNYGIPCITLLDARDTRDLYQVMWYTVCERKKVFLNIIFAYRPFPVSIQYGFFLMKLTFVKYHIGISAPLFLCSRFFSTRLTCQPKNFEQVLDNDGKIRLQRVT